MHVPSQLRSLHQAIGNKGWVNARVKQRLVGRLPCGLQHSSPFWCKDLGSRNGSWPLVLTSTATHFCIHIYPLIYMYISCLFYRCMSFDWMYCSIQQIFNFAYLKFMIEQSVNYSIYRVDVLVDKCRELLQNSGWLGETIYISKQCTHEVCNIRKNMHENVRKNALIHCFL